MRVDYRFPKYPRISPECRDLIQRILVREPDQRLTIQQIQEHPWCARSSTSPLLQSLRGSGNSQPSDCLMTLNRSKRIIISSKLCVQVSEPCKEHSYAQYHGCLCSMRHMFASTGCLQLAKQGVSAHL